MATSTSSLDSSSPRRGPRASLVVSRGAGIQPERSLRGGAPPLHLLPETRIANGINTPSVYFAPCVEPHDGTDNTRVTNTPIDQSENLPSATPHSYKEGIHLPPSLSCVLISVQPRHVHGVHKGQLLGTLQPCSPCSAGQPSAATKTGMLGSTDIFEGLPPVAVRRPEAQILNGYPSLVRP
jgi:hypothetical protein